MSDLLILGLLEVAAKNLGDRPDQVSAVGQCRVVLGFDPVTRFGQRTPPAMLCCAADSNVASVVNAVNATRREALHVYYTYMAKKLTITIDDEVYDGLYLRIGARKIGRFLESLARPHVVDEDLESAYHDMAEDEEREAEAHEWVEGLVGEAALEPR